MEAGERHAEEDLELLCSAAVISAAARNNEIHNSTFKEIQND